MAATHIESLKTKPDVDRKAVTIGAVVRTEGGETTVRCSIVDSGRVVGEASIADSSSPNATSGSVIQPRLTLSMPSARLWSPSSPFLYDLQLVLLRNGQEVDRVNSYFGEGYGYYDYLFGTKGSLIHNESDQVRYLPQGRPRPEAAEGTGDEKGAGSSGYQDFTGRHMQNFFDCVRSRKEPICPFELGFRSAVACQMAIASLRQQRTVHWDPETEEIV